jgi:hypothetical protein
LLHNFDEAISFFLFLFFRHVKKKLHQLGKTQRIQLHGGNISKNAGLISLGMGLKDPNTGWLTITKETRKIQKTKSLKIRKWKNKSYITSV